MTGACEHIANGAQEHNWREGRVRLPSEPMQDLSHVAAGSPTPIGHYRFTARLLTELSPDELKKSFMARPSNIK